MVSRRQPKSGKSNAKLREGEYPAKTLATNGLGQKIVIESTMTVPQSERLTAPIKDIALSEYLLPFFEAINIRGKSGLPALLLLARMGAHRYDNLKRFVIAWEDLHQPNLFAELYPELAFREPSLEQCCDAAKLDPEDLVGDIFRQAYHYGGEVTRFQLHFHLPQVEEAAYQSSLLPGKEGHADRKMLLEAGKIVEKGPQQVINVNNQAVVNQVAGLPKWEDSDKLVSGVLLNRQLPEQSAVEAEVVEVEATAEVTVEAEVEAEPVLKILKEESV